MASTWLQRARERAIEASEDGVMATVDEDLMRIFALPAIPPGVARCPDREAYAASLYNHAKPADFALRDVQIDCVYTYETYGGLMAPVGVGWGKTIIAMMCAKVGVQRRGHQRAVVLVPAEVYSQLKLRDLPDMRRKLSLDALPIYLVTGDARTRMRVASTPGPGVFVYAYSMISQPTGFEELCAINATLYVCDEAHYIASVKSARTKRWRSTLEAVGKNIREGRAGPDVQARRVEVVALSGTITKKSVEDYAHLSKAALHEDSPAPISYQGVQLLSSMVDADVLGTGLSEPDLERMHRLIAWANESGIPEHEHRTHLTLQEQARFAYQHRLRSAPGVVGTGDASVTCSLIISWSEPPRPITPDAERMAMLMRNVVDNMITPNDDPIDFGMHTYKWLWELTGGFYNSLVWPDRDEVMQVALRRGRAITEVEAAALLDQSYKHHGLQQTYHKLLRQFLDTRHQPGCDTPMLVAAEIVRQLDGEQARFRLDEDLIEAYRLQREAWFEDLPERRSVPVRVCDYKVKAAVEWCRVHAERGLGGYVWFHHPELGRWLHEELTAQSIPHTLALAGQNEAAFAEGVVLASYAHATGKNLQHQSRNLILELRREAHVMEQMLGRTHRAGQLADDVRVDVFISNGFDLALFNAILRDADYAQSTTGQPQRLCYATYAPVVPMTSPRLAMRLGILPLDSVDRAPHVRAHDVITPAEALDIGDVFRSVAWAGVS